MAEIKSAIELAMERTRNLVMDEAEKKESQRKDTENRLRAIVRRYLEGMTEEEGALQEAGEIKAEASLKKRILMELLLDELDVTSANDRLMTLLRKAGGNLPEPLMEELDGMRAAFALEMEKKADMVREEVIQRLTEMGISGDGIEPNLETWEEWGRACEETGRIFETQLGNWKERLARAVREG